MIVLHPLLFHVHDLVMDVIDLLSEDRLVAGVWELPGYQVSLILLKDHRILHRALRSNQRVLLLSAGSMQRVIRGLRFSDLLHYLP